MRQSLDIRKPVWEVWTNAELQWSCLKGNTFKAWGRMCTDTPENQYEGCELIQLQSSCLKENSFKAWGRIWMPENQYEKYELMQLQWSCLKENACFQSMRQDVYGDTRKKVWEVWTHAATAKLFKVECLLSRHEAGCVWGHQKTSMRGMNSCSYSKAV